MQFGVEAGTKEGARLESIVSGIVRRCLGIKG